MQEMAYFSVDIRHIPLAIIYAPLTSYLFILWYHIVKIWEASMTSLHMIFETKASKTSKIKSIYLLHDGNKILVGSKSGIVRM